MHVYTVTVSFCCSWVWVFVFVWWSLFQHQIKIKSTLENERLLKSTLWFVDFSFVWWESLCVVIKLQHFHVLVYCWMIITKDKQPEEKNSQVANRYIHISQALMIKAYLLLLKKTHTFQNNRKNKSYNSNRIEKCLVYSNQDRTVMTTKALNQ